MRMRMQMPTTVRTNRTVGSPGCPRAPLDLGVKRIGDLRCDSARAASAGRCPAAPRSAWEDSHPQAS